MVFARPLSKVGHLLHHQLPQIANLKDQIVSCALGQNPELLLRPFSIDAFIAENYFRWWTKDIGTYRDELITYVSA